MNNHVHEGGSSNDSIEQEETKRRDSDQVHYIKTDILETEESYNSQSDSADGRKKEKDARVSSSCVFRIEDQTKSASQSSSTKVEIVNSESPQCVGAKRNSNKLEAKQAKHAHKHCHDCQDLKTRLQDQEQRMLKLTIQLAKLTLDSRMQQLGSSAEK